MEIINDTTQKIRFEYGKGAINIMTEQHFKSTPTRENVITRQNVITNVGVVDSDVVTQGS
jgi:hypothetical protein